MDLVQDRINETLEWAIQGVKFGYPVDMVSIAAKVHEYAHGLWFNGELEHYITISEIFNMVEKTYIDTL